MLVRARLSVKNLPGKRAAAPSRRAANSNTREGFASARTVVAHNRVYHGGLHASRLTVRVEP